MASVNWMKVQSASAAKAMFRHDCKDTRQATANHSNKQLDVSLTPGNYGSREGNTYADACARYDARIDEIDQAGKSSRRKDRVTMVSLNVPTPVDLPQSEERRWFARVRDVSVELLGQDNFLGMWVHQDEKHEYKDAITGDDATSRTHAHMGFVPGIGEGDKVRLCAKELVSRANMVKLNNAIEEMSVSEFGVHFMDGSKRKSRAKVEDLKRKSAAKLAELADELERREARLDERERALDEREVSLQQRERALEAAEAAPVESAAVVPAAPAKPGFRSLASIRQQTRKQARSVDGYNGQGPQFGR